MSTVTLSWDDPEAAAEFKRIQAALRDGYTWDADRAHLIELVRDSKISSEEGERDA